MNSNGSYILQWIYALGPWSWLILGVILLLLEIAVPGSFMVWLGLAALVVGVFAFLFDLSWQFGLIIFGVLGLFFLIIGRRYFARQSAPSDRPHLNERGQAMVGKVITLSEPIVSGRGRTKINDTLWRVEGPDLSSGAQVRVVGADGATLIVVAFEAEDSLH